MIRSAVLKKHWFSKHWFSKYRFPKYRFPKHWLPARRGRGVGLVVLAMLALNLGACGQRGDLVLPQEPKPADETPAAGN